MTRDVLIVGSGAGGGAMALALARAAAADLVLEKGPEHRREEYPADEGSSLWRIRPRAQGRASWIQKRTSNINVVLEER